MEATRSKLKSHGKNVSPRVAAYVIAVERVADAMKFRGWY